MSALCRDCLATFAAPPEPGAPGRRCPACGGARVIAHPELAELSIAHIDCDAFYANVEKRERPELRDRPVIVGGGRRGVVAAACYVARLYGIHSAMPMFKALKACPDVVVIRPDMAKYQRIGQRIREMMRAATPLVEPLSIDEAFLDLTGTEALHGGPPARTLARLILRVEDELGLTASIGLSYNKFLAKVASELDKPRGFAVLGRADAPKFLEDQPVRIIWGVGKALERNLARDGLRTLSDLRTREEADLVARYGAIGRRLSRFARGQDERRVEPDAPVKSISAETTFDEDIAAPEALLARLWPLCEKVAGRLKRAGLAGASITLKLKTSEFRLLTRSRRLGAPTRLAEVLYRTAAPLLEREADGRRFRLIGIGAGDLIEGARADPPDLLNPERQHAARVEEAIDAVRAKLGEGAIAKGRGLEAAERPSPAGGTKPRSR
ncbi:MAG: DNA polymerase IV [Proteobacteria bacterium]|nr:DNA polymerase IV [Pseudomonadota bacterium]